MPKMKLDSEPVSVTSLEKVVLDFELSMRKIADESCLELDRHTKKMCDKVNNDCETLLSWLTQVMENLRKIPIEDSLD